MKILLISIGTRGDCEPFLGVAHMLKERGEQVICAFPEQYRSLAEDAGLPFISLGREFIDLLDSEAGKFAMGGTGSFYQKGKALIALSIQSYPIQKKMLDMQHEIIQIEEPDCIIYHPKVTYPMPWSKTSGRKSILLSPIPCLIHEVENHAHVGFNGNRGKIINKLSYKLANIGQVQGILVAVRKYFNNRGFSYKNIKESLFAENIFYAVSPAIFPRPKDWPENAIVAGFQERPKFHHWTPDHAILKFISDNDNILFITFGSMVNPNPQDKARWFIEILEKHKIPTIINISGGGLVEPRDEYDRKLIQFVPSIPYDWAFPRMHAVIHHGGAGTTHSALKAGCASMAIPHTADQPMWDDFIHELGVGPKGIAISELKKKDILEEKILDLYHNHSYKSNAQKISKQMQQEDFSSTLYDFIVK
jgi:sterol 3beta-glucosyltransferase